VLKTYLKALLGLPNLVSGEIGKVKSICSLGFSLLLFFNKPVADLLKIAWDGISPWWGAFVLFLVAIHVLTKRTIKLEERQKPKFEILSGDGESFVQLNKFGENDFTRLVRIGVKNISDVTVTGVKVQAEKILGQDTPFLPINFHLTHDNPNVDSEFKQEFDLHPGQRQFVDIAQKTERGPAYKGNIILCYATKGVPNQLPANRYGLLVKVVGRDVVPLQKEFVLDVNSEGKLIFLPKSLS
jgi:hypothetical protein